MQPWCIPFPIWNQSVVPCPFLIFASWPAYRFPWMQVRWSRIPRSWRIFYSLLWSTQLKALLSIVNTVEVDIFLEFSCFFCDPVDVGHLISDSSAFSKFSLNTWKFSVHVLLKPGVENFEYYFASIWNEWSCVVVWIFFGVKVFSNYLLVLITLHVSILEYTTLCKKSYMHFL